jgi:hypothetical protein
LQEQKKGETEKEGDGLILYGEVMMIKVMEEDLMMVK